MENESLDDFCGDDTLFRIEVCGRFVNEVNIRWLTKTEYESNTLQFSAGKSLDFVVEDTLEVERFHDIRVKLRMQETGANLISASNYWREDLLEEQ